MNEEIKKLFTPISEGLPEVGGLYFVFYEYKQQEGLCAAILTAFSSHKFWNLQNLTTYLGQQPTVTHYLDLSKLTTKELAIGFAKNAFLKGMEREYQGHFGAVPNNALSCADFISQNKHIL